MRIDELLSSADGGAGDWYTGEQFVDAAVLVQEEDTQLFGRVEAFEKRVREDLERTRTAVGIIANDNLSGATAKVDAIEWRVDKSIARAMVVVEALADCGGKCDDLFEKVCSHGSLVNLMHLSRRALRYGVEDFGQIARVKRCAGRNAAGTDA